MTTIKKFSIYLYETPVKIKGGGYANATTPTVSNFKNDLRFHSAVNTSTVTKLHATAAVHVLFFIISLKSFKKTKATKCYFIN